MSRVADVVHGSVIGGSIHLLARSAGDDWSPERAMVTAAFAACCILYAMCALSVTAPPADGQALDGET